MSTKPSKVISSVSWDDSSFNDSLASAIEHSSATYQNRAKSVVAFSAGKTIIKIQKFDAEQIASANTKNKLYAYITGDYERVFRVSASVLLSNGKRQTVVLSTLGINADNQAFLLSSTYTPKKLNGTGEDVATFQKAIATVAKAHRLAAAYRESHNADCENNQDLVPLADDSFYVPFVTASADVAEFLNGTVEF